MQGARADVLWTDPPYGVSYSGKTARALRIANDSKHGLKALLRTAFARAADVLAPGAAIYVCHPGGPLQAFFPIIPTSLMHSKPSDIIRSAAPYAIASQAFSVARFLRDGRDQSCHL